MFDQWSLRDGVLYADTEVGIHLCGRHGLGETPLLRLLGDVRWRQLAALSGVDSANVADAEGNRLYATYYFVDIEFPAGMTMASIGENDQLSLVNTVEFDGTSMIDGYTFLYPYDWPQEKKVPLPDGETALELGIPFVHASNAFVRMVEGASWLKKGEPPAERMAAVPRGDGAKATYQQIVAVSGGERTWSKPPEGYRPLTDGKVVVSYVPDSDRDLNGLGLLYYANYPAVVDVIERRVLREIGDERLTDAALDRRSIIGRKSSYMANIVPPDVIDVGIDAWMREPESDDEPIRLFLNCDMRRRSDDRRMYVATAEKLVPQMAADPVAG